MKATKRVVRWGNTASYFHMKHFRGRVFKLRSIGYGDFYAVVEAIDRAISRGEPLPNSENVTAVIQGSLPFSRVYFFTHEEVWAVPTKPGRRKYSRVFLDLVRRAEAERGRRAYYDVVA